MLVLKRSSNQWLTMTHPKSGDVVRVKVQNFRPTDGRTPPTVDLVFDDDARNFDIQRDERVQAKPAERSHTTVFGVQGSLIVDGKSYPASSIGVTHVACGSPVGKAFE